MVTFGFYDSLNHDRRYNAIQFGSIFDGIIRDGIYMSIGTCFRVTAAEDMMVLVGIGRAWFNHTWILNDAPLPVFIPQSEVLLNRIDAIVIDVDGSQEKRVNDIIVVKGTPSSKPVRPTMINTTNHHQYPLAYITVNAGVTSIRAANITSMVGTSSTPYVTGIIETVNIDALLDQWQDQWNVFFENQSADMEATNNFWKDQWRKWFQAQTTEIQEAYLAWEAQWQAWYTDQTNEMTETNQYWKDLWSSWFYMYTNMSQNGLSTWIENTENSIMSWWEAIQEVLNENCCANLAQKVVELENKVMDLEEFQDALLNKQEIYPVIYDDRYDKIAGNLTNDQNVVITNEFGEPIELTHHTSEPILDTEMDPIKSTLKVVFV